MKKSSLKNDIGINFIHIGKKDHLPAIMMKIFQLHIKPVHVAASILDHPKKHYSKSSSIQLSKLEITLKYI